MRIFFSGIGGVGIGPLAMIALDGGYEVVGSDMKKSEVSKRLESRGVEVAYKQDENFIKDQHKFSAIDLFVYTSALPDNHPELTFARENGIETAKRHELINLFLKRKGLKMLAVAGTHGKTTTAGMLAWLFEKLEIPYSHSVGSTLSFAPIGRYQPDSMYFIYEADEFDRNFLNFTPFASIVTSVGFDHPDTYADQIDYDNAFAEFIAKSSAVVMWRKDTERFNVSESANIDILDEDVYRNHDFANRLGLKLLGEHNRANASLVTELAVKHLGFNIEKVVDVLNDFPGTDRRFEHLTSTLYTDYAHHPDEIRSTIQLASELGSEIVVVYQPHQNKRQIRLLSEGAYEDAFSGAKKVYWLPTFLSREDPGADIVSPEELAQSANIEEIEITEMNEKLIAKISKHLVEGDIVIGMSAGDLDEFLRKSYLGY